MQTNAGKLQNKNTVTPAAFSSKVAGSESTRVLKDNRPQAIMQQKQVNALAGKPETSVQKKAKSPLQLKSRVIQRYAIANGGRISANEELFWQNNHNVYAANAQFVEANLIPGQVRFVQGAVSEFYPLLHLVVPQVKAQSQLEGDTAGFDPRTREQETTERAKENYYPDEGTLTDMIMHAIREHPEFEDDKEEETQELIEQIAELVVPLFEHFGNFNESHVVVELRNYFDAQDDFRNRPLMPSDCGEMAQIITGANVGVSSENPPVQSGRMYGKMQNLTNRENSQWTSHFAAIIMVDGADHITMENAGAKASQGFSKPKYDHTWYFEMYGPAQGQSFADKYNHDLGH